MIKRLILLALILIVSASLSYGQQDLHRNYYIELSEDSLTDLKLELALSGFLAEVLEGTYSPKYVDTAHLTQYEFFFYTLKQVKATPPFYPPLILKSYSPDGENYFITIAFTGLKHEVPFIYKIIELKAVPYQDHYRFYCPFKENAAHFKTQRVQSVVYHYSTDFNMTKAQEFADFKSELAGLTATQNDTVHYYKFNSLDELLKTYGLVFDAGKCNFLCYDLGFSDNQGQHYVTGTNNENYIYGFLGDYLYDHLPHADSLYWPFVNGMAAYYGGYGLSGDDMNTLKAQFRQALEKNPDLDLLAAFKAGREASVSRHFSYYVMSAFVCEAVLKKHDFTAVLSLAYSGKNGEFFFKRLCSLLNIEEVEFHSLIVNLIHTPSASQILAR